MSVRTLGAGLPLLVRAVQALSKDRVVVGIPADSPPRRDPSELSNAAIGYVMENGAPDINLPARPFLGPGLMDARPEVVAILRQAGIQALKDTASLRGTQDGAGAVETGLNRAGAAAAAAVKARIERGPFAPLSARTLASRRSRGRQSTKPLLDTEQMYDAVTFRVEPKAR